MNKNKLRWKIYNFLVKKLKVLHGKRGGFSLAFLYEFVIFKYGLELGIFMDPVRALVDFLT